MLQPTSHEVPTVYDLPAGVMDPQAELDLWDSAITELDAALADAATARLAIGTETVTLERLEAGIMLGIEGGDAESRKARLTLALADDARYEACRRRLIDARHGLMDAERRVQVSKERCRLLRAAMMLTANGEEG